MNPIISFEARLGDDPALRFTPAGMAIASFSVVTSDRVKDGETWTDKNSTWFRCSAFKGLAENVAESLRKGDLVIITGKLSQRDYENKDGEKRTSHQEIAVNAIGPSLQFSTVSINRAKRGGGGQGNQDTDPWGSPPVGGGGGQQFPDDPPFVRSLLDWEIGEGIAV